MTPFKAQPLPPHAQALASATLGTSGKNRKEVVADFLGLIGPAFDGIMNYNAAGRYEDLLDAVKRLPNQQRIPMGPDVLIALAQRINELSAIVEQNALTADDLPQAGWGVPEEDELSNNNNGDDAEKGEW